MHCEATKYGILVCVDGSPASDAASRFAACEAALHDVPLTLMHVVPFTPNWPTSPRQLELAAAWEEEADQLIEQARRAATAGVDESARPEIHSEVLYATPVAGLIEASEQSQMIVVGSQGTGALDRLLLGSVSDALARHGRCPVAVVHNDGGLVDKDSPVLVGVDGSPESDAAIATAFDEASRRRVNLVALHVWSDVGVFPILGMDWREYEVRAAEVLAERLAGWQELYPDVHVQRKLCCDRPSHWLVEESRRSQLVVVGSRGRGGFPGMLLGSVTSTLLHRTKTPVIVHRSGDPGRAEIPA